MFLKLQKGQAGRVLTGPAIVAAVLLLFWLAMLASLRDKSLSFDEGQYAIAGSSYWRLGDFRLNPEGGQLAQLVAGLPLALGTYKFPATGSDDWRHSQAPVLAYDWFYGMGNDAGRMAASGRAACGLLAVLLGAVACAWSRRLFGPGGGMITLLLCVLSPAILANGALMTADTAAALFFLAATWGWWAVLQKISAGRLFGSALLAGGLFVSKMSAVLIIPVMLLLAAVRLCDGRPLPITFGRWRGEIGSRARQALVFGMAAGAHAVVVVAVIWSFYGFRFSASPPGDGNRFVAPWEYMLNEPAPSGVLRDLGLSREQFAQAVRTLQAHGAARPMWSDDVIAALDEIQRTVLTPAQSSRLDAIRSRPPPGALARVIDFSRRHELLPEAWLYGLADVLRQADVRRAFWNGEYRETGWAGFFPYTFLVKTPLSVFGICGLALAAGWMSWRAKSRTYPGSGARVLWRQLYPTLPLWVLMAVYWAAAISSHLNIGHRHLLPVYAPIFVLCGASAGWIDRRAVRWAGAALCGLLVLLAAETIWRFPNYVAYFNGIVRPADAYRHLVDSSLDWGQELPAISHYIERHPEGAPFYLSYFGVGSPEYYGVAARLLYSYGGPYLHGTHPAERRLSAGTYLISATMLQPVYYDEPRGPWNSRYELVYRQLQAAVAPLLSPDPAVRAEASKRYDVNTLGPLLDRFEQYRLARLTAYLRQRAPDALINDAILVYRLTDADLARALE